MPGLLDLPAELIEQIYDIHHDLVYEDDSSSVGEYGQIRLVCRYIERAIRRSFRQCHFGCGFLKRPRDAHIEKFCAVTKIPDLARTIERLVVYTDDDGATESEALGSVLRSGGANIFSGEQDSSSVDVLDELLPPALVHHRDALLTAIRACSDSLNLELSDYKGFHSSQVLPDDQSPRSDRLPEDIIDDKHICDVTSTFNFFLSLMAEAGKIPGYITIHPLSEMRLRTGLTNAVGLVRWKQVLVEVRFLDLCFIDDWRGDVYSAEEAGARIGRQLCESSENWTSLTRLHLNFDESSTSAMAWQQFAQGPTLPSLERLSLHYCNMRLQDFSKFILKHCHTLKHLFWWVTELYGRGNNVEDLKAFFYGLRASPTLEHLSVQIWQVDDDWVDFPTAFRVCYRDAEDEQDYILVDRAQYVHLKGFEEVQEGLGQMAECMVFS